MIDFKAATIEKLRQMQGDSDVNIKIAATAELTTRATAAELARREQAQAPQPENLHQYKSALANMEQTINDLRRENARLRSLLASTIKFFEAQAQLARDHGQFALAITMEGVISTIQEGANAQK